MSTPRPLFNESPISKGTLLTNFITILVTLFGCYELMVARDYENKQEIAVVKTQMMAAQEDDCAIINKLDELYKITNQTYLEVQLLTKTKADKKYIE